MEGIGGSATFRWYGTVALIFCFLHVVVQKLMEKYWTRNGKKYNSNVIPATDVNMEIHLK